jgi:hypothetical protein
MRQSQAGSLAGSSVLEPPSEAADANAPEALRALARKELHGPMVKFNKPHQDKRGDTLHFSFGQVNANADPTLLLQLRVELLREFPLFGKKETADTIWELETIVGRYRATRNRLEQKDRLNEELRAIQLNFDQVLKKYAMDYAEKNGFNLTIKDSFGAGDYLYIEKKRWRRWDVSYEMMKDAIAKQFDNDRIAFVRPYVVIERKIDDFTGRGRDVIRFYPGQVRGLDDQFIVADLFRFELFSRYPYVDEALFAKHACKIEAALKKQYQDYLAVPLWKTLTYHRASLEDLLFDLHKEAAKAKGMEYDPPVDQAPPLESPLSRVIIETDERVKLIEYTTALNLRLAGGDMSKAMGRRKAKRGDEDTIRPGVYKYQLELQTGEKTSGEFDIPRNVTRDGKLILR